MSIVEELKEVNKSLINDLEEIGQIILKKLFKVMEDEMNQYIHSFDDKNKAENGYKTVSMTDYISDSFYLTLLFNSWRRHGISPYMLFNEGKSLKRAIDIFCKENGIVDDQNNSENKEQCEVNSNERA